MLIMYISISFTLFEYVFKPHSKSTFVTTLDPAFCASHGWFNASSMDRRWSESYFKRLLRNSRASYDAWLLLKHFLRVIPSAQESNNL